LKGLLVPVLCWVLLGTALPAHADGPPEQEEPSGLQGKSLLGGSLGYTTPTGGAKDLFGGGVDLTLDYVQGLKPWLGLRFSVGSLSYGEALDDDVVEEILGNPNQRIRFQLFPITVGALVAPFAESSLSPAFYAGAGLYNYQILGDVGLVTLSNQESALGIYGGADLTWRWLSGLGLFLRAEVHHAFSGSSSNDLYHILTGETRVRVYSVAVGVRLVVD
jgi:hypothetical protein